jgi:hypothetical protein
MSDVRQDTVPVQDTVPLFNAPGVHQGITHNAQVELISSGANPAIVRQQHMERLLLALDKKLYFIKAVRQNGLYFLRTACRIYLILFGTSISR